MVRFKKYTWNCTLQAQAFKRLIIDNEAFICQAVSSFDFDRPNLLFKIAVQPGPGLTNLYQLNITSPVGAAAGQYHNRLQQVGFAAGIGTNNYIHSRFKFE